MSRYQMENGMVVDTEEAVYHHNLRQQSNGIWDTRWSIVYRSRRGRWYLVHNSQWQGEISRAEYISADEAARRLLADDQELPDYPEITDIEKKLID